MKTRHQLRTYNSSKNIDNFHNSFAENADGIFEDKLWKGKTLLKRIGKQETPTKGTMIAAYGNTRVTEENLAAVDELIAQ